MIFGANTTNTILQFWWRVSRTYYMFCLQPGDIFCNIRMDANGGQMERDTKKQGKIVDQLQKSKFSQASISEAPPRSTEVKKCALQKVKPLPSCLSTISLLHQSFAISAKLHFPNWLHLLLTGSRCNPFSSQNCNRIQTWVDVQGWNTQRTLWFFRSQIIIREVLIFTLSIFIAPSGCIS